MKVILAITVICLMATTSVSQKSKDDFGLPELHKIKTVTLSPSYSCRTKDEFRKGYEQTALFLSKYSKERNAPDLLFNGSCGAEDYFDGSTAGDEMSLIADLGEFPVENVSALIAFNKARIVFGDSTFLRTVRVEAKHTYAVLINKADIRGLFVFSVDQLVPNKSVSLRYAVKEYQLLDTKARSKGFDWERKNSEKGCDCPD
jgi:hypothetical protein